MGRLVGLKGLLVAACVLVPSASASIVYRMEGGHCTDSSRSELFDPTLPNGGGVVVGPTLCSNRVVAELRMRDSYVPPGSFNYSFFPPVPIDPLFPGESFYFSDGFTSIFFDFSPDGAEFGYFDMRGTTPVHAGKVAFQVGGEAWLFRTDSAGAWIFSVDVGSDTRFCGLGSIPGPVGDGALCNMFSQFYESVGTYGVWRRAPEPGTIVLLGIGLVGIAARRRLKK